VPFAAAWLLAATLTFAAMQTRFRVPVLAAAMALLLFGVLLRPNALVAAPLLGAYLLYPINFQVPRAALLYAPIAVTLLGLQQFIYYGVLHATLQHAAQSIMVFDLGGISHYSGENQFPGDWSGDETNLIIGGCYRPTQWDIYWTQEPCLFVMQRLEQKKLFGTPVIVHAWTRAVTAHPFAYLRHRAAFMWNFLTGSNLTIWTADIADPAKPALAGHSGFAALRAVDAALKPSPLSRPGMWLLACLLICALAWRRRDTAAGAFAIATCGSAAVYVLTFFAVGVASDFRYAYGAVLSAIAGAVTLAAPVRHAAPLTTPPS